eukprot:3044285-Prymnesium_polylepis.1
MARSDPRAVESAPTSKRPARRRPDNKIFQARREVRPEEVRCLRPPPTVTAAGCFARGLPTVCPADPCIAVVSQ